MYVETYVIFLISQKTCVSKKIPTIHHGEIFTFSQICRDSLLSGISYSSYYSGYTANTESRLSVELKKYFLSNLIMNICKSNLVTSYQI